MSNKSLVYTTTGVLVIPYHKNQSAYLEQMTSTYDKICHKWIPHTGFYNEKLDMFALYMISKDRLLEIFRDYKIVYWKSFTGKCIENPFSVNVELNKYQRSAAAQLIGIDGHEAYINIPTASGKTVLAVTYISMNKKKTLIMCYSSKILEQWVTTFEEKTDIDINRVLTINSSEMLHSFLSSDDKKHKRSPKDYDIYLCTSRMIDSFGERYGYDKLQPLLTRLGIGLKIIDEAHTRLGSTIRLNAYTSIDKTLYLSADFNQANRELLYQFRKVFQQVPVIKLEESLMSELRHITAITVKYNTKPNANERLKIVSNKYKWSNIEHARYEFGEKSMEMDIINTIVRAVVDAEKDYQVIKPYKILILVQLIETVDFIYDHLITGERTKSKFYSTLDGDEKQSAMTADIIISTYKSFSTGIDVVNPQIRHVISTSPVDPVTANQSAGRCRPIQKYKSYFWMLQDCAFEYCAGNAERVLRYLKTNKIGDAKEYSLNGDGKIEGIQIST